jgi:MFS family permease
VTSAGDRPTGPAPLPWLRATLPMAVCVLVLSTVVWFRVPLLPAIGDELTMSPTALGWVVTLFGVGRLAMDLPAGRLADRVELLHMFTLSALALCAASVLLAVAPAPGWVLLSSVLLGAASATGNTTGMTAVSTAAPPERRGSAMALYSGSLLIGQAIGPALAGAATTVGTWRTAVGAAAALALVVAVGAAATRRSGSGDQLARAKRERPAPDGPPLTPLQQSVLFSVGFSVFFTVGAMPQTLLPLVGSHDLALSTAGIGYAIGLGGLARLLGAAVTGGVSDRVSRRAALLPCLVLQAAGVALLAVGDGIGWWVAAIVLMSLGSSGHAVGATMLADRAPGDGLGRALGRYRFAGDVGLVVGPVTAAAVYELAGTTAAVAVVCGVLVVGTATAAGLLPETGPRRDRTGDRVSPTGRGGSS